ncbi:hypothetical protein [Bradyrhizobium sp. DASA03120]|uniref:hypothetical protein n=1 Tax=Bradyrhizobium sp. SMVTL-02 TaxID=3395917 RepID=UPI003F7286C1
MPDENLNAPHENPAPEVSVEPVGRPLFDYQLNGLMFVPRDWYWLAEDGRVYSSARQAIIDTTDATFAAWVEAGYAPTGWPRNLGGEQTKEALQDVVKEYRLTVP